MLAKYVKPRSLTWWSAVTPLAGGLFIAFTPVHGLGDAAESIRTVFGGVQPAILINAGLAGIGLRGAMA